MIRQENHRSTGEPREPIIRVYRGVTPTDPGWEHSYSRGFNDFGYHMEIEFPDISPVDLIIRQQVERANKQGRKKVVVLDLGAGDGNFTKEFLSDPQVGKRTRGLLKGKTDVQVEFLSITDAETPREFLQETQLASAAGAPSPEGSKLTAREIKYSVTSFQTVRKLLERLSIDSVDVVVASNFMAYLQTPVFQAVMEDAIEALNPGGQIQVFGYATIAGSRLSIDDGNEVSDEAVIFSDPLDPEGGAISVEILRQSLQEALVDEAVSAEELRAKIAHTYELFYATGTMDAEDEEAMRGFVDGGISFRKSVSMLRVFLTTTIGVISQVENLVRVQKLREEKEQVLEDLKQKYKDEAVIEYKKDSIRVKKLKKA